MDSLTKLKELKAKLAKAEIKYSYLMKGYRGVIHESAASEIRHSEVKVYEDYISNLKKEIKLLEES